ncbi:hypothetical protein [Flavobacterium pectinovorum]|uniref:hypothetical protein n=1 Tax=Flavobacterium pectinovorum TaxID=29533 RepID=UPI001FADC96E|nr:hypothetical protein [Flavobacterium pectinovorum]MCI9846526.1 hypothetical protein [Flavobacterium pectinovorum]
MLKKIITFSVLFTFLMSCNSKEKKDKYNQVVYQAINDKDTAVLAIKISDKRFYGRYERSYYRNGKDSGDVRGDIKGDTLRGDFHYITSGGGWKRIPIALLKKENKLFLGNGVIGTYMNLPCFLPGTLNYKDSEFIFKEVKK